MPAFHECIQLMDLIPWFLLLKDYLVQMESVLTHNSLSCHNKSSSWVHHNFSFFFCKKFGGFQTPFPGGITPGGMTTGFSTPSADLDLIKIGEARKSLVGVKLDQVCNCLWGICMPLWLDINCLTPKIWLLILLSSCYTFPHKLVTTIWC